MSTFRTRGMSSLRRRLTAAMGITISITRKGALATTLEVPCVIGDERSTSTTPGAKPSGRLDDTERDFLINVGDYKVDGVAVEPKTGDLITEIIGGLAMTFEIRPRGDEKSWRWSDPTRLAYRCHGKKV